MKQVTCPMYLHDNPIKDDDKDASFDVPGIHLHPHHDPLYREEGYYRFVFVWKDGSVFTDNYQVHGKVWDKFKHLLKEV